MLWDGEVKLKICSHSTNHIGSILETSEGKWHFTGVCGFPEANRKVSTFRLLDQLRSGMSLSQNPSSDLPWCITGDFNCRLADDEKNRGPRYHRQGMEAFRDFLTMGEFSDLGYKGSFYTWKHGSLRERLDRGISNSAWQNMFKDSEVRALAPVASDHNLLCISIHVSGNRRRKKRKFRLKNMWLLEGACKELIRATWKPRRHPNVMQSIMDNVANVAKALERWNKEFFGNF